MEQNVLTYMIFIPLAGAVVVLLLPSKGYNLIRWVSAAATVPPLLMGCWLYANFDTSQSGFQFVQKLPWIPAYNIQYFVGVDGLSISMILLTALLSFLCIFASFGIDRGVKGYFALFLMLLAMLALYFNTNPNTFDMTVMMAQANTYSTQILPFWPLTELRWGFQHVVWIALFIGFAIKIPAFPFHTWLPDAHVEAPTAISVILAGVLLKMGTYGILRVNYPMMPVATADMAYWLLGALGAWNIIYGALCAMAQTDLKKLVAYSSVSHMGYVMLGMASFTTQGINGAVLQMFNHGTITGMLFLLVGVLYDRAHHRDIEGFGGLAAIMPVYTGVTALAFFASMGLPGLSGFISEVLVLLGTWQKYPILTILGASGVILTAGYLLWTIQRVYLGPPNEKYLKMAEINGREIFTLVPLGAIVIIVGVYPSVVLDLLRASLDNINQIVIPHLPS